jgi:F0F1-type ATP synthase membrane subunit c/vacuolar-type H+-ATPase subunit K
MATPEQEVVSQDIATEIRESAFARGLAITGFTVGAALVGAGVSESLDHNMSLEAVGLAVAGTAASVAAIPVYSEARRRGQSAEAHLTPEQQSDLLVRRLGLGFTALGGALGIGVGITEAVDGSFTNPSAATFYVVSAIMATAGTKIFRSVRRPY